MDVNDPQLILNETNITLLFHWQLLPTLLRFPLGLPHPHPASSDVVSYPSH